LGKQGVTDAVLTDLPGYGYAAVPKEAKYRWQKVMGNYLQTRDNLKAIVLMCDPRLGLTELDEILLDVIRPRVVEGLKFLVLLTKSDKLNKTEAAKALSIVRLQAGGGDVKLFSSLKRQGVDEVALHLWDWAHPQDKTVKKPKTGLIELGQNSHEEDEPENLDEQEIQDELPALDEQNDDHDPLDPNSQPRG
jgi:GTP-binding protein